MKYDVYPDVLYEPFAVGTALGDSVISKRVHRRCPITLPNRVTIVHLVEIDMLDFYVILGMDWLHANFALIVCRTRVVKYQFPNKLVLECKGRNLIPKGQII